MTRPTTSDERSGPMLETLVAGHRDFLAFVERRVGDRALAEDVLQSAFVKSLDKLEDVRDSESIVAWFYRVLRRAIIDHARATKAHADKLERFARELDEDDGDVEARDAICRCVLDLTDTLKPEYAEALRRIDLEGVAVKDFAGEAGISASNAGVRVFRARGALREKVVRACGTCADHGCFECSCRR